MSKIVQIFPIRVLGVTDFGANKSVNAKKVPRNQEDLGIFKVRNAITFSEIACKRFAFSFAADQMVVRGKLNALVVQRLEDIWSANGWHTGDKIHSEPKLASSRSTW